MNAPKATRVSRSFDELVDAQDLRAAIEATLTARPVDDATLRRCVWSLVCTERLAGTSPGTVIDVLSELVANADIPSPIDRQALARRVVTWGVEAFFGHLGGNALCRESGNDVAVAAFSG